MLTDYFCMFVQINFRIHLQEKKTCLCAKKRYVSVVAMELLIKTSDITAKIQTLKCVAGEVLENVVSSKRLEICSDFIVSIRGCLMTLNQR